MQQSVKFLRGYTDENGKEHKSATIGRRIKGRDLFEIDEELKGLTPSVTDLPFYRAATVSFGELKEPFPMKAFLSLVSIDRERLVKAYEDFIRETSKEREVEIISDDTVRLAFGIERDGSIYNVAKFGYLLTGFDEIEADDKRYTGMKRVCYLLRKEIISFTTQDGALSLPCPLPMTVLEEMDMVDILALRETSLRYSDSFNEAAENEEVAQAAAN
ncbi:MAG TPA: hypothetical protein VF543_22350 [Pyrinomonadaceae bacterium]|jgi:hypothetical protein